MRFKNILKQKSIQNKLELETSEEWPYEIYFEDNLSITDVMDKNKI